MGDIVETATKLIGIKKLVKWVFGEDCGCDERKEKLNKIKFRLPYKIACMSQIDFEYWTEFKKNAPTTLTADEANHVEAIWNRIFNPTKRRVQFCRNCNSAKWQEAIHEINEVYKHYE